jgi:hypothetical protein
MKLALAAAMLAPLHCGPIPPEERAIPTGRYAYEVAVRLPDAADSTFFRGTLVVDAASPTVLAAHLEVADLDAALADGHFNVVSYRLVGTRPTDSLSVVHHLRPMGAGRAPRCTAGATRPGFFAEGRCSLRAVSP